MEYVVIDLETSGVNYKKDKIIELELEATGVVDEYLLDHLGQRFENSYRVMRALGNVTPDEGDHIEKYKDTEIELKKLSSSDVASTDDEVYMEANIVDDPDNNFMGSVFINNIKIDDSIFDEEKVNWRLEEVEDFIDRLIGWIAEAKDSDKALMKADLKMLLTWDDDFMWSSILTNDYISPTKQPKRFNEVCYEVLDAYLPS